MFGPHRVGIRRYLFHYVWFSLKSILTKNLNHSNWIRNEQVMTKIRTLVKIEKQNTTCTGTALTYIGTGSRNLPRMWVFLPFFHMLIPKSTQYSIYTSIPLQNHLVISILLKSSFNTYLIHSIELKHVFYSSLMQGLGFYSTQLQEI